MKTNLGHLEAAAGVAGFIKAVLVLGHNEIPPNLQFLPMESAAIDPSRDPVLRSDRDRPRGRRRVGRGGRGCRRSASVARMRMWWWSRRRIGVGPVVDSVDAGVTTLVVSGKSAARVASWAAVLADWMDGAGAGVALADVAHTVNHHRARYPVFATVCARPIVTQAVAGLRAVAAGVPAPGVVGPHEGRVWAGYGVCVFGSGFAVGGDGPAVVGRGAGVCCGGGRVGAGFC